MTDLNLIQLKHELLSLGDIVPLRLFAPAGEVRNSLSAYKDEFKPYNPRKQGYNRYGLSLTSLDGGLSGVPDLDSLLEYNKINKTNFDEPDFRKWTPFFSACAPLKEALRPFYKRIGRSHILRLDKGGFFPPHRDLSDRSFRLFIPFCLSGQYVFILDGKNRLFHEGQVYFINTLLAHSLFSFEDKSFFAIFNIDFSEEAISAVFNNLSVT